MFFGADDDFAVLPPKGPCDCQRGPGISVSHQYFHSGRSPGYAETFSSPEARNPCQEHGNAIRHIPMNVDAPDFVGVVSGGMSPALR